MKETRFFTSESVTEGHPDKIADQISDAILDGILEQDIHARVACETAVTTGLVLVFGEISTTATVNIRKIVRDKIREIGYTDQKFGFDSENCAILISLDEQSLDISQGIEILEATKHSIGAGDQGMMFGFAVDETPEFMPLPIALSHRITKQMTTFRKEGVLPYLRPDGKSQVTIEYNGEGLPYRIDTVVVSVQHDPEVTNAKIERDVIEKIVKPVLPKELLDSRTKFIINPSGRFVIGGPQGDAGLTGRKIIVDTYGGYARHGGGAFSGKDPSKVDRSGAYAARYIAKNIVAAKLAKKCEVQLAYAIGIPEPISISIDTFSTSEFLEEDLIKAVRKVFKLTPSGIIEMLDLTKNMYGLTAKNGHFGNKVFSWEQLDKVNELSKEMDELLKRETNLNSYRINLGG